MRFTAAEKSHEARRELEKRREVYSRLVDLQRMSRRDADRKLALMEEIAADYQQLAAQTERLL